MNRQQFWFFRWEKSFPTSSYWDREWGEQARANWKYSCWHFKSKVGRKVYIFWMSLGYKEPNLFSSFLGYLLKRTKIKPPIVDRSTSFWRGCLKKLSLRLCAWGLAFEIGQLMREKVVAVGREEERAMKGEELMRRDLELIAV